MKRIFTPATTPMIIIGFRNRKICLKAGFHRFNLAASEIIVFMILFKSIKVKTAIAKAFLLSSAISPWHAGDDIITLPDVGCEMWSR